MKTFAHTRPRRNDEGEIISQQPARKVPKEAQR